MAWSEAEAANEGDRPRGTERLLRVVVLALAGVAGAGVLFMMTVTCLDVLLRALGRPLTGAVDLVSMAGAVTLACAMPYTTAVKGHVTIEYFFHLLRRRGRAWVAGTVHVACLGLFAVLAWYSLRLGWVLRRSGEVSPTLQWPVFWIPWLMALSFLLVAAVLGHAMRHPRKELLKP